MSFVLLISSSVTADETESETATDSVDYKITELCSDHSSLHRTDLFVTFWLK